MSSYDATAVIEEALRAEVVVVEGLRLRPNNDELIALHVIDALEAAGFEIVRKPIPPVEGQPKSSEIDMR
jgi:hypothetical protein